MKKAFFGYYALLILSVHGLFTLLEYINIIPYFRTALYPMALLIVFLISMVGLFEKDKFKAPSLIAFLLSTGLLVHWILALILRLKT